VTDEKQLAWDILSTPNNADFKEYRRLHYATWLTKDRRILLISDMETSYIINCISMLEAVGQQNTLACAGLIDELKKRGGFK
jgi:hypothetical protein